MDNTFKSIIASITGVIGYMANCFSELFVVLVFLMISDYVTGIMAASIRKELSSGKGIVGIFKKFSFVLLVLLGFFADYVITYLVQRVGMNGIETHGALGIATICWLIGNEGMSIIENLGDIGTPIPGFIKVAFSKFKESADTISGQPEERKE